MARKKYKNMRPKSSRADLGDGEYSVDEILGKRVKDGRIEYLIKWTGYSKKYNSWQPEHNVSDDLIEAYENRIKNQTIQSEQPQQSEVIQTGVEYLSFEIHQIEDKQSIDQSENLIESNEVKTCENNNSNEISLTQEAKFNYSTQSIDWLNSINDHYIKTKQAIVIRKKGG